MEKLRNYYELIRIKHWIKNILIFVPLIFSGQVFNQDKLLIVGLGFLTFSVFSSIVYIINDCKDVEKDKLHPIKKNRPIASGKVTKKETHILLIVLAILTICLNKYLSIKINPLNFFIALEFEVLYLLINILYSSGLKDIPILDVVLLVSGFILRIVYRSANM